MDFLQSKTEAGIIQPNNVRKLDARIKILDLFSAE